MESSDAASREAASLRGDLAAERARADALTEAVARAEQVRAVTRRRGHSYPPSLETFPSLFSLKGPGYEYQRCTSCAACVAIAAIAGGFLHDFNN
eukprot:1130357-Pleurochrysis_carterae.AAC.1